MGSEPERLGRFFDMTGLTPVTLRQVSSQSGFAESLFDHLCADERLLLAFAADRGIEPTAIEAIRQRLALAAGEGS